MFPLEIDATLENERLIGLKASNCSMFVIKHLMLFKEIVNLKKIHTTEKLREIT